MNVAGRVLANLLIFAGALGAAASIVGLAEKEMSAFWLLSFSLITLEGGVLVRRLTRPLRVPPRLSGCLSRLSFLLILSMVIATYRAVVEMFRSPWTDPAEIATPIAVLVVWFFVWKRTRPSVWDVRPAGPEEAGE